MLSLSERVAEIQRANGYEIWPTLKHGPYPTFADPPESMGRVTLAALLDAQYLMSRGLYGVASGLVWDAIRAADRFDTNHAEEADDWLAETFRRTGPMIDLPVPAGGNARDRRRSIRRACRLWG